LGVGNLVLGNVARRPKTSVIETGASQQKKLKKCHKNVCRRRQGDRISFFSKMLPKMKPNQFFVQIDTLLCMYYPRD
jgi:hypothetical protein